MLLELMLATLLPLIPGGAPQFSEPPTVTLNPGGRAPLAAEVRVVTDSPGQVTLRVTDGVELWTVKHPAMDTVHDLPLFGLKPGRTYHLEVVLTPGGATDSSLTVTTAPLPDDFPGLTLLHSDPSRMEPGYTVLDNASHGAGDPRPRYTMIVDARGEVVWYSAVRASATRQDTDGTLIYRCGDRICNFDLFGRSTTRVTLQDPGEGLHHDWFLSARGTYFSLGFEATQITDFPTSETDPDAPTATAEVRDEPIFEFASDGTLLNRWSLTDMIDTNRIGYDSLQLSSLGHDWVHLNAVIPDPSDDSLIVSSRHQDAVIKFSRTTGELAWILAPHANWSPEFQPYLLNPVGAPFEWSYHQHAPLITPDGNLLLFDNGNFRASPFDRRVPFDAFTPLENRSRAVEYAIDEATMEIEQVWEYGTDVHETLYAWAVGDVDWLPARDNVLIHFGGTRVMGGVPTADLGYGIIVSRTVEVTHEQPAEKVFDLLVFDPQAELVLIYRAERIPSLYAPEVMVATLGPVAAGSIPDGSDPSTPPLTLDKDGDGVRLAWSPSCVGSDLDYSIYEGRIGDFRNHAPRTCSTGGETARMLAPDDGDRFFLVVPSNGADEGSYGRSDHLEERAPSASACLPQTIGTCPATNGS